LPRSLTWIEESNATRDAGIIVDRYIGQADRTISIGRESLDPLRPLTRLAQVEEPGLRCGAAGGGRRLGPLIAILGSHGRFVAARDSRCACYAACSLCRLTRAHTSRPGIAPVCSPCVTNAVIYVIDDEGAPFCERGTHSPCTRYEASMDSREASGDRSLRMAIAHRWPPIALGR
jgi:hypothetical protein